ncbi:hypothetical protein WJX73_004934 [Symbiochloris irregularis]|uniref:RRM domain-containing protein n=1 Tax=Symbiochloris irregularis TaxID=706552 RepID=A0AAW1PWF2_9CHLO
MGDVLPNQTIYVHNLHEKIKKDELKKCLYTIFSQFGKIIDVVALKTYRLRGQAWVVFAEISGATNALRSMQGFPFFDKPMKIEYAKTTSDAVTKLELGTNLKNMAELKKQRQKHNETARDALMNRGKAGTGAAPAAAPAAGGLAGQPLLAAAPAREAAAPPNKILFVQGLPETSNADMLTMLFQQFPGLKEVRMVEARPGIAFVEFDNDMQSSVAMSGLQNFKIADKQMAITFAKQ